MTNFERENPKEIPEMKTNFNQVNDKNIIGFVEGMRLFFCMLKDYFTGQYTEVPLGTIIAIIGSILYLFSPVDVIPDVIPVIGWLDDVGVLALCMSFVRADLTRYKEFKKRQV